MDRQFTLQQRRGNGYLNRNRRQERKNERGGCPALTVFNILGGGSKIRAKRGGRLHQRSLLVKNKFKTVSDVWAEHLFKIVDDEQKRKLRQVTFDIPVYKKINPKRAIAIAAVVINTPLPTMSAVSNIWLYKKIMKFNTDKFNRKYRLLKVRLRL